MNIQSNYSYNYNISMQGKPQKPRRWSRFASKIKQKIIDAFPNRDFTSDSKKLDKKKEFDSRISRPAENRLIMGATAILTQPVIDYYNHRVDEETRTVSRNRTIAKILAGTTVGILVRGACYKIVEKMTNPNGVKKISKLLVPTHYASKFATNMKKLSNYKSALSAAIAILVMCYTNFALDAPLTAFLTNKFNERTIQKNKAKGKEVKLNG